MYNLKRLNLCDELLNEQALRMWMNSGRFAEFTAKVL
jgi:hypothetical protein